MDAKTHQVIQQQVTLTPQQKGQYIHVPFMVPAHIASVTMRVEYDYEFPKCVIQPSLYGPAGIRGCCAVQKNSCKVSAEFASPGFKAGKIEEGEWYVSLSVAVLQKDTPVTVTIELEEEVTSWYKADLHLHGCHSDGGYTELETIELCREAGLQAIALTDHNSTTQNVFAKTAEGLMRIPGYEWTTRYGHANFIGVQEPVADFEAETTEAAKQIIQEAHDNGAMVVLNHPGDKLGGWKVGTDIPFDAYEVWNGPWRDTNDNSLALWQEMLVQGRKVPMVGGSDTHKAITLTRHGHPCNYIYMESFTAKDLLQAVKAGHCYVTDSPASGEILFTVNGAMMGDTVRCADENELHFETRGIQCGDEIRIINEKGLFERITASISCERYTRMVPSAVFYRIEVWRSVLGKKRPILLTNPIYIDKE